MRTGLYEPVATLPESRVSNTRDGETPRNDDAPTGAADTDCEPIVEPITKVDERSNPTAKRRPNNASKLKERCRGFVIER
jgi:hypothetical protein